MTHLDPDQVSTEATRCLLGHRNDRATGEYVVSNDRTVLLELEGDGLAHAPDEGATEGTYEAQLTGLGVRMLRVMGAAS